MPQKKKQPAQKKTGEPRPRGSSPAPASAEAGKRRAGRSSRTARGTARRGIIPADRSLLLKASIFDTTANALIIADSSPSIIFTNRAYSELSGFDPGEISGKKPSILISDRSNNEWGRQIIEAVTANGQWKGELWGVKKNGDPFPAWVCIDAIKDDGGGVSHYSATAFDMTQLKENERRLEHMAHYDMLTNLPNRSLMYDRLRQALILAKRYHYSIAVMLLDIDRFKEINDTMGHHVGDQLLMETAFRLKGCVRESDTVARMGGDEFLVILPEVGSANNAAHIAQKFLDIFRDPFDLEDHEIFVSSSIGVTVYPMDGEDMHLLVKNADTAMYHAKAQGKNNFKFFTEDINRSTIERFRLESRFRRAIEKLEFHLNYQPKVDIMTGEVCGMEALLRWYHPEQGSVNPSLFIPLAEETGLVVQLGEWAVREACRQNREWHEMGYRALPVSVNLSARHFHRKDITEIIFGILEETGLAPHHLMIEITEGTIIENVEETIETLHKFRSRGIGVSIDDFGTGYSSLNYLNRFPIDELKIDRSFVNDIPSDTDSKKVITAIIALAHNLNLKVVAEGVETAEQFEFLKQSDCDKIQGYFFSRPMSSEDFAALLSSGKSFLPEASRKRSGRRK